MPSVSRRHPVAGVAYTRDTALPAHRTARVPPWGDQVNTLPGGGEVGGVVVVGGAVVVGDGCVVVVVGVETGGVVVTTTGGTGGAGGLVVGAVGTVVGGWVVGRPCVRVGDGRAVVGGELLRVGPGEVGGAAEVGGGLTTGGRVVALVAPAGLVVEAVVRGAWDVVAEVRAGSTAEVAAAEEDPATATEVSPVVSRRGGRRGVPLTEPVDAAHLLADQTDGPPGDDGHERSAGRPQRDLPRTAQPGNHHHLQTVGPGRLSPG